MAKKKKIVYTIEQFAKKGFDGEVARFMRENRNSEIIRTPEGAYVVITVE